jgi:hypothetical protein
MTAKKPHDSRSANPHTLTPKPALFTEKWRQRMEHGLAPSRGVTKKKKLASNEGLARVVSE